MATKRMLVDATHPEETRIVVTNGNRLEEFDFESAERRQLRGNIYLAKVTRVEPSLQAAFVEYGGNRHGFLAFSEIHPDYYQIPVSDREALMRAEEEEQKRAASADDEVAPLNDGLEEEADEAAQDEPKLDSEDESANGGSGKNGKVDELGDGDALEDLQERPRRAAKRYKIQEVIKRRQVILVQVVKEERGNKGAALTTYLSLAGRYSVLMPNTARGGGISRKITSAADRKRLKEIASEFDVPTGMGVILRTAGASRTKAEVRRDFEYLMRLWENVRTLTLQSSAPSLVYEEGSLIKRTIRDLYNREISEVLVSGDEAYREAKGFMRMIMPSHAKNVQAYKDDAPIFSKFGIESQLDSMFHPQVTLPSGGYIVINPTEALVSIDVNSGRATKEHSIEDTALATNLEAAEEISRQLRLRDLAGLIVIDFIDMDEKRNNRAVERKLKDCLKNDRARIQVGHISHFGLMEMSRQRMRFGVLESSTHTCPTCAGTGLVRAVSSLALMIMRAIEDHVLRKPGMSINVRMPSEVALYILNAKRHTLAQMEHKYGLSITISADPDIVGSDFTIEKGESRVIDAEPVTHIRADAASLTDYDALEDEAIDEAADAERQETRQETRQEDQKDASEGQDRNRKKRRRRRGGSSEDTPNAGDTAQGQSAEASEDSEDQPAQADAAGDEDDEGQAKRRRRRGRRGGRRNKRNPNQPAEETADETVAVAPDDVAVAPDDAVQPEDETADAASDQDAAAPPRPEEAEADAQPEPVNAPESTVAEDAEPKPKRTRRPRKSAAKTVEGEEAFQAGAVPEAAADDATEDAPKPKKARTPRKRKPKTQTEAQTEAQTDGDTAVAPEDAAPESETPESETPESETPKKKRAPRKKTTKQPAPTEAAVATAGQTPEAQPAEDGADAGQPEPVEAEAENTESAKSESAETTSAETEPDEAIVVSSSSTKSDDSKPKKVGWWQRGFFS